MDRINERAAVFAAMLKAGVKWKPKLPPAEFARRFALERLIQQRRYCDALVLWRRCRSRRCRRAERCIGDAGACLRRALVSVPHQAQWQARQRILDATPANIGAPERKARQCMPRDCYD
jgi:hypothetical protein